MTEQRVSFRYAKALLETATKGLVAETIFNDFQKVALTMELSRELRVFTASPVVQQWKKKKIFTEVFNEVKISELTLTFLILLIDKRRGNLILDIIKQYEIQYNRLMNKLSVIITSAVELSDEIKQRIIDRLSLITGKQILADFKTNIDIQGGIIVRIDDWVFDASVKNQLSNLFKQLSEGSI